VYVSEPADLAPNVLLRVAEFLRRLPADQVADLANGVAQLEVVPKGGRRSTTSSPLPRPAAEIAATMQGMADRRAARQYLLDLKLTVPVLKALAKELGVTVRSRKADAIDDLVEWAVGRRLDSEAIERAVNAT
jgi:hypothetical protein